MLQEGKNLNYFFSFAMLNIQSTIAHDNSTCLSPSYDLHLQLLVPVTQHQTLRYQCSIVFLELRTNATFRCVLHALEMLNKGILKKILYRKRYLKQEYNEKCISRISYYVREYKIIFQQFSLFDYDFVLKSYAQKIIGFFN